MSEATDPGDASSQPGLRRDRLRRGLLLCVAALYVVSVPWYRSSESEVTLWLGLPDWVALALACYIACAVLNSLAWLLAEIPDSPPPPPHEHRQ
jgi:hypothetical protein